MTGVSGYSPFHIVEWNKGWMLGGVSMFVFVFVCVSARARVVSLAARAGSFPGLF